jgi:nucleotide-binding universal stress UspA family protein
MKILVPTDGSEYSETAIGYVNSLRFGPDTELYILHVLKDYLLPDSVDPARDFVKAGKRGAEALVLEVASKLSGEAKVHTIVREGDPWREIVEAAEEVGVGLVIMGHKGLTGINRFLLGSVSHQVLRHCASSVLVVREPQPQGRQMRALFCTDGSESAAFARDMLMKLPFRDDMVVHALSVVDVQVTTLPEKYYPDNEISQAMADLREYNLKLAEKALERDAGALRGRFHTVQEHITFGIPEPEILRAAEDLQVDLVVLGSKGLRGIQGALLGSASQRVVKHADCAVLVTKMPEG